MFAHTKLGGCRQFPGLCFLVAFEQLLARPSQKCSSPFINENIWDFFTHYKSEIKTYLSCPLYKWFVVFLSLKLNVNDLSRQWAIIIRIDLADRLLGCRVCGLLQFWGVLVVLALLTEIEYIPLMFSLNCTVAVMKMCSVPESCFPRERRSFTYTAREKEQVWEDAKSVRNCIHYKLFYILQSLQ